MPAAADFAEGYSVGDVLAGAALLLFFALVAAAIAFDVRERRVPNGLVLAMLACGAVVAWCRYDAAARGFVFVATFAVCAALVATEVLWRRWRGDAGLGMGDIKALFCMMLVHPVVAVASFAVGLLALAVTAAVMRRPSLPLMPFFGSAFLILWIATLL